MLQINVIPTDIDQNLLIMLADFLSPAERTKAMRLRQVQDQKNYIVAHAALRILLTSHVQPAHHPLSFSTGPWGKPLLTEPANSGLHFNLSHSGSMALIAITSQPVGIDIEIARPLDYYSLAHHNFAAEETTRIADSHDFFDTWTAKEAVVKASGQGLACKLQQFVVPRPSDSLQAIRLLTANSFLDGLHVAQLPVDDGYHAALSMAHHDLPLLITTLDPTALIKGDLRQASQFME